MALKMTINEIYVFIVLPAILVVGGFVALKLQKNWLLRERSKERDRMSDRSSEKNAV